VIRCRTIILVAALIFVLPGCSNNSASGIKAPDFFLNNLSGQTIALSDFRGKPVVINFWQLSCPPCIDEMPFFDVINSAENKAIILTIAIGNSSTALNTFMKENGYSFTVLRDPTAVTATTYRVRYTPTTFFIDSHGQISDVQVGAFASLSQLNSAINKLN
jgi:peroxiredoxin